LPELVLTFNHNPTFLIFMASLRNELYRFNVIQRRQLLCPNFAILPHSLPQESVMVAFHDEYRTGQASPVVS
jgi:hypothetical protein